MKQELKKSVIIYGSYIANPKTQTMADHQKAVYDLGVELGKAGFDIVTGGGVGMMGAACDGAKDANPEIKCIGVDLEWGDYPSFSCKRLDEKILFSKGDFTSRLATMKEKSSYQIVCPGGKGTLRELFEAWEELAMDYEKQPRHKKIILYPASYWQPIYNWITTSCHANGYVFDKDYEILVLAQTPKEVLEIMQDKERSLS
ncbi:LOG family protein [bacterium]|nr:LOG family protein [bacterium]